jgi:serine/threonine-protein kinase
MSGTPGCERRIGDRVEKYEFLRAVARGGMGSVWAAKLHGSHGFEKIVAIKTVLPELAGDDVVRAMFLDEARLASAIDHRNVARVLDFMEHEGALYLVMEWIDGVSLSDLHKRMAEAGARIPVGVVLRVLADVCAGLHAAHELEYSNGESCGLVHRDVSPHNVLVAVEGAAKLIDFGVALTRFPVAPEPSRGQLRGRLDFIAPEQSRPTPLDRRADIWSVGATLFYLLAGHGPLGACDRVETLRRLLRGAPPVPAPPDTHPAVVRLLAGCLTPRPEDRFPTAERLGWAIEEAIEEMGVAASAGVVAGFLAENGYRTDSRIVPTGRCAIPRDLTYLRTDTVSKMRVRPSTRATRIRRAVVALACMSVLGTAAAGANSVLSVHAAAPSSGPAQSTGRSTFHDKFGSRAPATKRVEAKAKRSGGKG